MTGKTAAPRALALTALMAAVGWGSSLAVWRSGGQPGLAASLFGAGVALGPCLAAYALSCPAGALGYRTGCR